MKINDVLKEDGDTSGDYQKMLAFVNANRVGGVPADQQIPLALFKEIQKQRQQNQALSAELSDAEKRINQALGAGELSKKELGMHRGELDRERAVGQKQQAAIGQMGQQYAEREKASAEQMKQLTGQLDAIKSKPGVDQKAAEELEDQIKQLSKNSVSADQISSLEAHIATVQDMQSVDDQVIKDLVAQVNAAQKASRELEKTKQTVGRDAEETAQRALDQIEQIKQQLAHFKEVEDATNLVRLQVNQLAQKQQIDDKMRAAYYSPTTADMAKDVITKKGTASMLTPASAEPNPQMALPGVETPAPTTGSQIELPGLDQTNTGPDRYQNIVKQVKQRNPAEVYESAFNRSIAWATGKKL
jgi:hypothetical protein